MNAEVGSVFPVNIETEGTVMDYVDHEFMFVVKDETWSDFECNALKKQPLQIDFVYKYDIAVFLLTLEDAIDTSDFIFSCHDNEYDESLYRSFTDGDGYTCVLYLIDANNIIKGKRKVTLSQPVSNLISSKLKAQKETPYYEEEFTCNLEGLQNAYEPFEMQPLALATQRFK